jgi:hypothetical protein
MHLFQYVIEYWWVFILVVVGVIGTFVVVAGRRAGGGFRGRTREGWRRWRELSERAATVQARILLTIFYFTVMLPVGIWQGFFADRLRVRGGEQQSYWLDRRTGDRTLDDVRRQF